MVVADMCCFSFDDLTAQEMTLKPSQLEDDFGLITIDRRAFKLAFSALLAACTLLSMLIQCTYTIILSPSKNHASLDLNARAVNYISPGLVLRHHPIFFTVAPVPHAVDSDYIHDFLGMRTRTPRFCNEVYMLQPVAHPLRVDACRRQKWAVSQRDFYGVGTVKEAYPIVGEEYWEYISTLKAVTAYPAAKGRPFTMVEVGAGYCHWTVSALLAAKLVHGKSVPLVSRSIDGGDLQIEACKEHLADNGLGGVATAFTAALTDGKTPTVLFSSRGHFGAAAGSGEITVEAIAVPKLIDGLGIVDYFDIDIQGGESLVFADAVNFAALNEYVKYIHVGTHGELREPVDDPQLRLGNLLEFDIVGLFEAQGWERVFFHPRTSYTCWANVQSEFIVDTEMGPVCFGDDVMAWVNPRLVGK